METKVRAEPTITVGRERKTTYIELIFCADSEILIKANAYSMFAVCQTLC